MKDEDYYMRVTDRSQYIDVKRSGFVERKNTPVHALYRVLTIISLVVVALVAALFYDKIEGFYILVGYGVLLFFVAQQLDMVGRHQLCHEFLSALLSSSLSKGYRFCMVARQDGEIIYLNQQFHEQFPEFLLQQSLNVAIWCNIQQVQRKDADRIADAVAAEKDSTLKVQMLVGPYRDDEVITLHFEPVSLPRGYTLIRGK